MPGEPQHAARTSKEDKAATREAGRKRLALQKPRRVLRICNKNSSECCCHAKMRVDEYPLELLIRKPSVAMPETVSAE